MRNVEIKIIVMLLSLLVIFSFWRVRRIAEKRHLTSSCLRASVRLSVHLNRL